MARELQVNAGRLVAADDPSGVIGECVTNLIRNNIPAEHFEPGGDGESVPTVYSVVLAEDEDELPPGAEGFDITTDDVWVLQDDRTGDEVALDGSELRELLTRGRELLAGSDERTTNREFSEGPYPAGLMLGEWQVGPERFGGPNQGIYVARHPASGERAMVTLTLDQPTGADAVGAALEFTGAPDLVHASQQVGPDGLTRFAIVERVDPDRWIRAGQGELADWRRRVRALCDQVQRAHDAGQVMGFLRPELVFEVDGELTATPRAGWLAAHATRPSWGVPPLFELPYLAPEVLRGQEPTLASDVFGVAAVVAWWLSARYPFAGNTLIERVMAIGTGRRSAWSGPRPVASAIDDGLAVAPDDRPSLGALADGLLAGL